MRDEDKDKDLKSKEYHLHINRRPYKWGSASITGADIKVLAGSPADYVVNLLIDGPGEDPEIGDAQLVDLTDKGVEKFLTRKPKTTPGA